MSLRPASNQHSSFSLFFKTMLMMLMTVCRLCPDPPELDAAFTMEVMTPRRSFSVNHSSNSPASVSLYPRLSQFISSLNMSIKYLFLLLMCVSPIMLMITILKCQIELFSYLLILLNVAFPGLLPLSG